MSGVIGVIVVILLVLYVYLRMKSRGVADSSIPDYIDDTNNDPTFAITINNTTQLKLQTISTHSPEYDSMNLQPKDEPNIRFSAKSFDNV